MSINNNIYYFLRNLKGAWKNNSPFFQIKWSIETYKLALLLKKLGFIEKITLENNYMLNLENKKQIKRTIYTKNKVKFCCFLSIPKINNSNDFGYFNNKNIRKLFIFSKTQNKKIKFSELKKYDKSFYCVMLLQTKKGIITNKEALINKIGGTLICKIYK